MASSTRSTTYTWLIGHPVEKLTGSRLPSTQDVFRTFVYYHKIEKLSIHNSAVKSVEQVLVFWEKARIPTTEKYNAIKRLEKLFDKYQRLKKIKVEDVKVSKRWKGYLKWK